MKKKSLLLVLSSALLLLAACDGNEGSNSKQSSSSSASGGDSSLNNETDSVTKEDGIDIESDFASQEKEIFSDVTIIDVSTINEGESHLIESGGKYLLTGENENARVVVSTKEEVTLVFSSLNLTSLGDAPIEVQNAGALTIHLASATKNYLADSENNTLEACLLVKKVALVLEGEGYLYVSANGLSNDSIDSGVAIQDAKGISVTSSHIIVTNSVSHALNAKAGLTLTSAKLSLTSAKDAIHSKEGGVTMTGSVFNAFTKGDGIDAATDVIVEDSQIHVETVGEYVLYDSSVDDEETEEDARYVYENGAYRKVSSDDVSRYKNRYYLAQKCKGFKTEGALNIDGGEYYFQTSDDGLASDSSIAIESGEFSFDTLDQAINTDGTLTIGQEGSSLAPKIVIGSSFEGIQGGQIDFYGSYVYILSNDDGINATSDTLTDIAMNFHDGAKVYINAEGDGIDSNGSVTMEGGDLYVFGPSNGGDCALDSDSKISYQGGNIFAFSEQGMVETPSTDKMNVVSLNLGSYSASSSLGFFIDDSEFSAILPKAYSRLNVIIGGASVQSGSALKIGTISSSEATFVNGFYVGEKKSTYEEVASVNISSGLTTYGSSSGGQGGGNPGGNPGGGPR